MKINGQSLGLRLLVPAMLVIIIVFMMQLALIENIVGSIRDDYAGLQVMSAGSEVAKIIGAAVSDLTSSKLIDNPVVVESKQKSVMEALALHWSRSGYEGVVVNSSGQIIYSTVHGHGVDRIAAGRKSESFMVANGKGKHVCNSRYLPLWGWYVITVGHVPQVISMGRVVLLVPLVLGGCILMMAGIYLVIRKNLQRPIRAMLEDMGNYSAIRPTGISELDAIGSRMNITMENLRENARALESELAEHQQAEETLRARDAHINNLLAFMEEGMYGVDREGFCTFCNASGLAMLGYADEADLLGRNIHEVAHHKRPDGSHYPAEECRAYEAFRSRSKVHVRDEVFWRADGSPFPVEYWAHPVVSDGLMVGAVVTFRDMTEELMLQQQLLQQQKIESIGLLAGGIAHDFNNMLTPIYGYAEMIQRKFPADDQTHQRAAAILAASAKARDLVAQLLSFSRKQTLSMDRLDLNEIINTFSVVFMRTIRENIQFRLELSPTPCNIMASRTQLEQVILNLAVNAQDAISADGQITLETEHVVFDDESCSLHPGLMPGAYVMLAFSDNGCGIPDETLKHIFDPFFSTKPVGHGTGLGLSTIFGIVKQHEGFIDVQSRPGAGTTFRIYLPSSSQANGAPGVERTRRPPAEQAGALTVLLVEDNQMVLELVSELLENAGHSVLAFLDPQEALDMVAGHAGSINLLVSDVVMPKMNGLDLYQRLREFNPDMPALFISGYLGNMASHGGQLMEEVHYISKPFSNEKFLKKIDEVLGMSNEDFEREVENG